ncbi:hypothetical protein [Streptomyces sp. NPDC047725]|uniref:hypothetical protein n=1 Tax=Streptomyces sp. NPDC047725 TaxID=3365487 RepID=UPI00372090C8
MRVYVDGMRKIDLWKKVSATAHKTVDLTIPSGKHTIRVDDAAWTGYASAAFTYAPPHRGDRRHRQAARADRPHRRVRQRLDLPGRVTAPEAAQMTKTRRPRV